MSQLKKVVKKTLSPEMTNFLASRYNYIKYHYRIFEWFAPQAEVVTPKLADNGVFYIFGTPISGNLGDQAIAMAQSRFLQDHFKSNPVVEFQINETLSGVKYLRKQIKPNDVIFIQAGGNIGDIYYDAENVRRKLISTFPNNAVVQLPQSLTFRNPEQLGFDGRVSQNIYKQQKQHFYLFARDHVSEAKLKQIFPENNIQLVPDIVLSLNERAETQKSGVLFALRSDVEKELDDTLVDQLRQHIQNEGYAINETDTDIGVALDKFTRDAAVQKKIAEFQAASLVVTDRLHGMIFSVITGTPAIVFDNYNSKVKNEYNDWLSDYENIRFFEQKDHNQDIVAEVQQAFDTIIGGAVPEFDVGAKYKPLLDTIGDLVQKSENK
ncbi:polysaccharide pyruvyl transferase family protein [Weissella viridescens]|nr:polysaccharide pyruvyl transferase family protein [Weissella viridescens]